MQFSKAIDFLHFNTIRLGEKRMKKNYGNSRYSGNIVNGIRLWLVLVVLISSIGPISVSAKVVWEDNFDDGNYDGWTINPIDIFSASQAPDYWPTEGWLQSLKMNRA